MVSKLGYDSYVKRLNSATVAALALVAGCMDFSGLGSRCERANQRHSGIGDLDQFWRTSELHSGCAGQYHFARTEWHSAEEPVFQSARVLH